jgi:hypothetical protein
MDYRARMRSVGVTRRKDRSGSNLAYICWAAGWGRHFVEGFIEAINVRRDAEFHRHGGICKGSEGLP